MSDPSRAPSISLSLAEPLRAGVCLGLVSAAPVVVGPSGAELLAETATLADELARRFADLKPAAIEDLAPARELYRLFGIDPTKTRPSSEALLRRVLKSKPLPRIISAVDLCNLLSLKFLLPIGLYDAGKITGDVELRRGNPGESFPGIRKADVHLDGRPVLVDPQGPFGNPTSDSLRTSVDERTTSLWMVIFAPASFPAERMAANVRDAEDGMRRHLRPDGQDVDTSGCVLA
jgi:DNA/RNA-binding domain of Phe-tRNA-synthetase-like protein